MNWSHSQHTFVKSRISIRWDRRPTIIMTMANALQMYQNIYFRYNSLGYDNNKPPLKVEAVMLFLRWLGHMSDCGSFCVHQGALNRTV